MNELIYDKKNLNLLKCVLIFFFNFHIKYKYYYIAIAKINKVKYCNALIFASLAKKIKKS